MRLPSPRAASGPSAASSPSLLQGVASAMAALMLATSAPLPMLAAPPPSSQELQRLSFGLARIDYLIDHWDEVTTVCSGVSAGGDLEDAQVMRTQNQGRCYKTPLKVQKYIGAASTLDPLFKADKLMIRAQPLVAENNQDAYSNAVDAWITKQQMSSTMAYTSSWSGIENPNGSVEQIEENLIQAKNEVLATRKSLQTIVGLLGPELCPPSPKFNPNDSSTWPLYK